ncbi:purple acid phosphatase-like protein (ISS) [Dorcoceras hygrometricum]|uniref:Purple acid phosphatase-like protein (ISS) n=1 Tax=Dorcoceras hygrometricum TaxID=472368 RepID=A0A2Z7C9W5_9LAMI|nr:purple acid phosphatase-like protein (ISS) [Dorcoceras hygrometricum]
MRTSSNKKPSLRNDRKVLMAEESTKSWADSDSESSSSSSSSSDSEQEEAHCLMADHASDDEVFEFANTEFTREDLVQALNDMVHEYMTLSHTFEEIKAENASLKNSSAESSSDELEDTDSLKTELSRLKIENDLLRNEASELKAEVDKLTKEMSSWNQSTRSLFKLYESQKPLNDKTGVGFNYDSSYGETSTQSQPVYDKFNERSFVKGGVIHDCLESIRYDDQDTSQLDLARYKSKEATYVGDTSRKIQVEGSNLRWRYQSQDTSRRKQLTLEIPVARYKSKEATYVGDTSRKIQVEGSNLRWRYQSQDTSRRKQLTLEIPVARYKSKEATYVGDTSREVPVVWYTSRKVPVAGFLDRACTILGSSTFADKNLGMATSTEAIQFSVSGRLRPASFSSDIVIGNLGVERFPDYFLDDFEQGVNTDFFAEFLSGSSGQSGSEFDSASSNGDTVYRYPSPPDYAYAFEQGVNTDFFAEFLSGSSGQSGSEFDSASSNGDTVYRYPSPPDYAYALGPPILSPTVQEERLYFVQSPVSSPAASPQLVSL